MRIKPWFVAVFGCTLLLGCGGGGASSVGSSPGTERPVSTTVEAPPANAEDPTPSSQQPTASDRLAPVNPEQPLPPAAASNNGQAGGGSRNDPPPPGKKCSASDQCGGCKDACELCLCTGLTRDVCVLSQVCK